MAHLGQLAPVLGGMMNKRITMALVAVVGALSVLAAACGDDKETTPTPGGTTSTCTTKATADQLKAIDSSGDGKLTVGVITPGPRNDGAYYQSLVECADRLVKANNGTSI